MKAKLPLIARILMGLIFTVFGVMGLFNLIPPPANMPDNMMKFMTGLLATGYFMKLLKITEVLCIAIRLYGYIIISNRSSQFKTVADKPTQLKV